MGKHGKLKQIRNLMKLATITAILGVAQAIDIDQPTESLLQEAEDMEVMCKDMDTIDNDSLLEATEDVEIVESKIQSGSIIKNIKGTHTSHYRRSKKVIDAENKHILST